MPFLLRQRRPSKNFLTLHLIASVILTHAIFVRPASAGESNLGESKNSQQLNATETAFKGKSSPPAEPLSLWYRQPAQKWVEALPIGNGRLGAMVFGGVNEDRLQLNEDTLWAGGPYDPANPDALAALPEVRRLIFAGDFAAAHKLIAQKMMAHPLRQMPYETVGDLLLKFPTAPTVDNYRRDLNLNTAIAQVTYQQAGTTYTRQFFASPADQVIVIQLSADKPAHISFTASMRTPLAAHVSVEGSHSLLLDGANRASEKIPGALKFQARTFIETTGGKIQADENTLTVTAADSATILIALATSYKSFKDVTGDPAFASQTVLAAAQRQSFNQLLDRHVAEHQRLFRRVSLNLGSTAATQQPTDVRIDNFDSGNDPQLAALYFQFGRYLLISCSRPGGQPANLQGLWNDSMNPPWGGKYTININTEMNYWPAESCNLAESVEPLIDMVGDLAQTGARTAEVQYGARGWVAHHNTDLWRATGAIDGPQSGMWPTGGAWLCLHLWDHYLYSGDKQYLARVYPLIKGAALFFLDTLVEDPNTKYLVTCPSLSPEHNHGHGDTSICAGPAMDSQIIHDLFTAAIQSASILDIDEDFRSQVAATLARLAPPIIGAAGQLQEWQADWDLNAPDIHHRHVSHLFALFPGTQISLRETPDLAAAAKKSLEIRGDRATGWGLAWRLNLWAHLDDGDHAYQILKLLLTPERTYPDLFDAHPPFQIDGNFGAAAGIAEMLLQSTPNQLELLPALPTAWPNGSFHGLRARSGFEVDCDWQNGKLHSAIIHSHLGKPCHIRYANLQREFTIEKGQALKLNGQLNRD